MSNKSFVSPAVWFIPLVAVILAVICLLIWVGVKQVYHYVVPQPAQPVKQTTTVAAPVIPFEAPEEEPEPVLPPEVEVEDESPEELAEVMPVETCPATAMPLRLDKPKRQRPKTAFEKGLAQCMADGVFPCAWEDQVQGVTRHYWLMSAQGPIQRGIYNAKAELIHETIATLDRKVTQFTEQNTTWYYEGGVLVKVRTSPYDNCNFHDWFFIDPQGNVDVCQCAYSQEGCCARSPYKQGDPRTYCERNPLDKDFCK